MSSITVDNRPNTLPNLPTELFLEMYEYLFWSLMEWESPWRDPQAGIETVVYMFSTLRELRATSKALKQKCDAIITNELDKIQPEQIPKRFRVVRYDMTNRGLGLLAAISQSTHFASLVECVEYEAIDIKNGYFDKEGFLARKDQGENPRNYYYSVDFYDQHNDNISTRKDQRIAKAAFESFPNLKHIAFTRIHIKHPRFASRRVDPRDGGPDDSGYIKPKHDTKALLFPWYWTGIFNIARVAMHQGIQIPLITFTGLVPDLSLTSEGGRKALGWMLRRCENLRIQCRADYVGKPHSRNGFQAHDGEDERKAWREFVSCAKGVSTLELSADLRAGSKPHPCKLLGILLEQFRFNKLEKLSIRSAEFRTTDLADFLDRHRYQIRNISIRGYPFAYSVRPSVAWWQVFAAASRIVNLEEAKIFVDHHHVAGGRNRVLPQVLAYLTNGVDSDYNFGEYVLDQHAKIRDVDSDLLLGFQDLGTERQRGRELPPHGLIEWETRVATEWDL